MALIPFTVTVIDHVNNPNNTLANTGIEIRTTQSGEPLAQIYSDDAGLNPIPQPGAQTNNLGVFYFYAESEGDFDYKAVSSGFSENISGNSHNKLTNRNAVGAHDAIYRRAATVAQIENGDFAAGSRLTVTDRANAPCKVVAGGVADGYSVLDAGNGNTATIELVSINNAEWFGAKLDWDGTSGTDDTDVFIRIHELGVSYSTNGKFGLISSTLPIKDHQKVYFFGGGLHKSNSGYIYSSNGSPVNDFIAYNGNFTGDKVASLFDLSAGAGYPASVKNCKLVDCNANQMYVLFNFSNARACQIVSGRYACHTALQMTNKSAECTIESALLIKDEGFQTAGTKGISCFSGVDGYPEGLTVKDCLIFRFEHNYAVDDLFIGKFSNNYVDSADDCLQSYIAYGDKTEGIEITGNWFFQRGLVIGKDGESSPRQFRSNITNNHFNNMIEGTDMTLARWTHGVTITGNQHNSDGVGTHVCVVCEGNNNGIIIDNPNPLGYTQYVQMKISGENNSISNIPNVDGLAAPISLEYPVNIYNVEGYYSLVEGALVSGSFAAGAVIASADNVLLSAGVAHLSFDIGRVTIPGDGFLKVVAYTAGTFDIDPNIVIAGVSGFTSYSSGDSSIRFGFPVAVKKATKTTFAVIVETGSATITGGVSVTDGLAVMQ